MNPKTPVTSVTIKIANVIKSYNRLNRIIKMKASHPVIMSEIMLLGKRTNQLQSSLWKFLSHVKFKYLDEISGKAEDK